MDKLNPTFQDTDLNTRTPEIVANWYETETTNGYFTPTELSWLQAQGWRPYLTDLTDLPNIKYYLQRRIIKPERALQSLITSYTTAYNEGRQLNDQRYDDLLTLYLSVLDKVEDAYNALETDDDAHELLVEALVTNIASDFTAYDADVTGDLDNWGTEQLAEINARFDAESSRARQALTDRGLFSSSLWTNVSAGIERERTRALNGINDLIEQRQLELKHKVYEEEKLQRARIHDLRHQLRGFLHDAKARQVAARNEAAAQLGRLVEVREDTYPDLNEIGRLAASLGAGSAEGYQP